MSKKALILGGTKGLGLSLAKTAMQHQILPTVLGRDVKQLEQDGLFPVVEFIKFDLYDFDAASLATYDYNYFIWCAGVFLKKDLCATTDTEIDAMINLHFRQPVRLLRDYLIKLNKPLHLIVIASCSSWKLRDSETIYTGVKAAQAAFTRNLVPELKRRDSTSKVTLINPGGLDTPNFHQHASITKEGIYLDPDVVANIIWQKALSQVGVFSEWQILRDKHASVPTPIVTEGARIPELPG